LLACPGIEPRNTNKVLYYIAQRFIYGGLVIAATALGSVQYDVAQLGHDTVVVNQACGLRALNLSSLPQRRLAVIDKESRLRDQRSVNLCSIRSARADSVHVDARRKPLGSQNRIGGSVRAGR
jgi:hypothetical protein